MNKLVEGALFSTPEMEKERARQKQRNFRQLLEARWDEGKFVCVGLDSQYDKIPKSAHAGSVYDTVVNFNRSIIQYTHNLACAYKLNSAFYEALGGDGFGILYDTIRCIWRCVPDVPVILDAKRADIDNTNLGYVQSALEKLGADAITVHPYLGKEALQPFLDRTNEGIIVLCRTSNKGAGEFQDLEVPIDSKESGFLDKVGVKYRFVAPVGAMTSLSNHVAYQVRNHWNANDNCLLVVGATYPSQLADIRKIVRDMPLLIPGIGAQGGDLEATVKAGKDSRGLGMIINSSRGIIYASSGEDYAEAARRETLKLHGAIQQCLKT